MFVGSSAFSPQKQNSKMLENNNPGNILTTITMIYCFALENNVFYPADHFQVKDKTIVAFFYKRSEIGL